MSNRWVLWVFALISCGSAIADLQNVSVGGELRIRYRYWDNVYLDGVREVRIPEFYLQGRPIGPFGAASRYSFDDEGKTREWVEQSTRLRFSADFTHYVNAVIEFDDTENWGTGDFRSDYLTGVDSRANSGDDVEVLQSYIETNETFGVPLRLRIGRQQIKLGGGWLVGENQATLNIAFDGVRATYAGDTFTIDGWATKLAERGADEEDGDVDFYGLSAACTALSGHEFLLYWLYLRDGQAVNDTNFAAPIEWLEDVFHLDDYNPTKLHTVGFRASGKLGSLDYAGEVAYQFGEADRFGALFAPVNQLYGDEHARFDQWGGDMEIGYTFENMAWTPRAYIGGAYFGGEDHRGVGFWEWLNPFDRPEASVSFNRLFSSKRYYELFDEARNGTNFYQIRGGVDAKPTESVSAKIEFAKLGVNERFDAPFTFQAGRFRIPAAPALAFLTEESAGDIGYIFAFEMVYHYSENLTFKLSWNHLFADGDVDEGNFVFANGLEFLGGSDCDDANYVEFETRLKF